MGKAKVMADDIGICALATFCASFDEGLSRAKGKYGEDEEKLKGEEGTGKGHCIGE